MVFEDNDGGVDDKKAFLHDKRCDVYVNEKEKLIKGEHLEEFVGHYGKNVLWEVQ